LPSTDSQPPERGSPLGLLHTASGGATVAVGEPEQEKTAFWQTGQPPFWADDYGWDEVGPWAIFHVKEVEQRLRWMSAGSFMMGSPEGEEGRDDDEGPQHEVLLRRGFWLFDTPCTQALWQAVMRENPSHFKGEQRPVERVSWEVCQEFMQTLNAKVKDLALSLPTEAEWEHACRAGTETPRYAEDLDNIAWYDKNSESETHPVGQKEPNAWGLYDMLGNVEEWCHDGRREYMAESMLDPVGPLEAGVERVIRGGSWFDVAQSVRAAYRYWYGPGCRYDGTGFRCASSGQASRLASRGETASGRSGVRSETVPTDAGR
jgi:formylglycine-generating enzyme required for sulfatase activity